MVLVTTVAIVTVTISVLYFYFTRTFNYWKDRNIPGPKPVPFFGNLYKSATRNVHTSEVFKEIYSSYPDEKVVGIFAMTTPWLMIRDLEIMKGMLIKDFDNFMDRGIEFSKEGLAQNLFHSDGETWRALRNRFTPLFTNQKLKNMIYLLDDRANKFVDYVSEITAKSAEQDAHALVQKYTMSTITACAFGLDIDTFRGDIEALTRVDKDIFNLTFFFELTMMYPGFLKKLNMNLFPKYVNTFFKELVETVITQRNGMPSNRKDFMDSILEMRNQKEVQSARRFGDEEVKTLEITNNVIEAQAFVFYGAGYETTATTLGYLLYQLAVEPEIQARLINEIDEYLQRHDGRIELDTLNELKYLDQVFSETLRMYPVVETLQRKALNDYECPGTNLKISKGQMVFVSALGIHRDEKYYPNPDKFNPDNFAPENVAGRHPFAYLPFGVGPRHCIGMRFAQVQSRVCVIRLLSKFRVEASKNTVPTVPYNPYRIVLSPKTSLYVNLFPRDDVK